MTRVYGRSTACSTRFRFDRRWMPNDSGVLSTILSPSPRSLTVNVLNGSRSTHCDM